MANLETPIPLLKLNDGTQMPMLGYGSGTAWYKKSSDTSINRELVESIKTAIKIGYNHLDAAEVYGTEAEVGLAIKESKVPREKLYVTTKVLPHIADIPKALNESLKKLQLDYVDLYLIHHPKFAKTDADLQQAWQSMEKVKAEGKVRSIGVSNYLKPQLDATLATAKVPPALNQVEFHPYLQHGDLLAYHREHNIAVAAYGPLTAATKAKPGPVDASFAQLAKKYFVSEGEISLRWCIDQGVVAITTSSKEQRLSDYLRSTTFSLNPREVEEVREKGQEKHFRGFWTELHDANDRS